MPPMDTYQDYFARAETNTFRGHNDSALFPYQIDITNAAAIVSPAEVARQIYATSQEGMPTAFLQCH